MIKTFETDKNDNIKKRIALASFIFYFRYTST